MEQILIYVSQSALKFYHIFFLLDLNFNYCTIFSNRFFFFKHFYFKFKNFLIFTKNNKKKPWVHQGRWSNGECNIPWDFNIKHTELKQKKSKRRRRAAYIFFSLFYSNDNTVVYINKRYIKVKRQKSNYSGRYYDMLCWSWGTVKIVSLRFFYFFFFLPSSTRLIGMERFLGDFI